MSILITTPTQLDALTLSCSDFILKKVVTNIPDYDNTVKTNLIFASYKLTDKAFRGLPIEGLLMLFKNRHGIVLPPISDFYVVDDALTSQQALQDWGNLQTQPVDKNPVRFVTSHLAYFANFNDGLFYQLTNPSLSLVNIPIT